MHGAAIRALGLDAAYLPFAVRPEALPDAVRGLRALGLRGVNVTLPHKAAVIPLLDEVSDDARAIGAVNTIINDDGWLRGENTDAPGLVRSIEEAGVSVRGRRVTVLGAGGAARAAVVGLCRAGASELTLITRRPEAARALANELRGVVPVPLHAGGLDLDALEARFEATDLLVQASSATLNGGPEAEAFAARLPVAKLPNGAAVVDLVYQPRRTTVLEAAAAAGLETVDGLGMLLHQGALAFRLWTGLEPPLDLMDEALERSGAATMSSGSQRP
jgi:shikimate dehydrogenase